MDTLTVFLFILYIIIFVLNLIEIIYLVKHWCKGEWYLCSKLSIMNLAVVDFITGISGIGYVLMVNVFRYRVELTVRIIFAFGQLSSLSATVLLTFDRYIATIFPFKYRIWRTKPNVIICLTISWTISLALQTVYHVNVKSEEKFFCPMVAVSVSIFATSIFMIYAYWSIFRKMRTSRISLSGPSAFQERPRSQMEKKLSCISHFLTECFLLFTTPLAVIAILGCAGISIPRRVQYLVFDIFSLKSLADPIIFLGGYLIKGKCCCYR